MVGKDMPGQDMGASAADGIEGRILEDKVVQPGQPWGRRLNRGEHLRIIDLEGKQAVDFLCYNASDTRDRYNAANTTKLGRNIFLGKGPSCGPIAPSRS